MISLFSNLVENCFGTCTTDFTSKALTGKEEDCVKNCADKFFNLSSRFVASPCVCSAGLIPGSLCIESG